jgi:O-antigen ligase
MATVRPEDGTPRESDRIGFKRAYGPTMHPIYFGALQLLLLPWMVYAASRSLRSKSAPSWWAAMPLICILGICGPVSRAPIMAVGIMFYVMFMILRPQSRRTMSLAAAAVALVLAIDMLSGADFVLGGLERITGEDQYQKEVVIDGRKIKYTATRHRFLLFDEYGYALRNAGLFGWGTDRLSSFPPNVPRASANPSEPQDVLEAKPQAPLTIDVMTGKKLRPSQMPRPQSGPVLPSATRLAEVETLDNSYLLFTLRFGYIGLIFFTAITATAAWNYIRLALLPEAEGKMWLTAMAGTVVGMAFVLFTVWMPQDFGYFYLFLCGASAGLLAEKENPKLPPDHAPAKHRRRKRRSRRHRDEVGDESSRVDPATVSTGDPAVEETPS